MRPSPLGSPRFAHGVTRPPVERVTRRRLWQSVRAEQLGTHRTNGLTESGDSF